MANTKKQARQEGAAKRLDAQLASGVKKTTVVETNFAGISKKKDVTIPLTEHDKKRIVKERAVLKDRTGK